MLRNRNKAMTYQSSVDQEKELLSALKAYLDKPERWAGLAEIENQLSDETFYKAFVNIWTESESNDLHLDLINDLIKRRRVSSDKIMPLMRQRDRNLMDQVRLNSVVYRGAQIGTEDADYSWTTDLVMAEWFARRCSDATPVVLTGRIVDYSKVLFAFASNENEIAILPGGVEVIDKATYAYQDKDVETEIFFLSQRGQLLDESIGLRLMIDHSPDHQQQFERMIEDLEAYGFMTAAAERRDRLAKALALYA